MVNRLLIIFTALFLSFYIIKSVESEDTNMKLTSPQFKDNEMMPKKFTCQGEGVNPALIIENTPSNAKSIALICDDPDAVGGATFVHWVVFNIPPVTTEIKENSLPGMPGINSGGRKGYYPPCPPYGKHRYVFKAYALDTPLSLPDTTDSQGLENAMKGHTLDKTELTGLYEKH